MPLWVLVPLTLQGLLLGLLWFTLAVRNGGVKENEKSRSPPIPRALAGPVSDKGRFSRVRRGGGGRRDNPPCSSLTLGGGQSSGKEKAWTPCTSPSSLNQGNAEDGGTGTWLGVSGGSCEPTTGGARELQLRSHSFWLLRAGLGRGTEGGTQWMGVCGQL